VHLWVDVSVHEYAGPWLLSFSHRAAARLPGGVCFCAPGQGAAMPVLHVKCAHPSLAYKSAISACTLEREHPCI